MSALFGMFAVHCFFGACNHVVRDFDSHAASRTMQEHYDADHVGDLTRLGFPPRTKAKR